MSKEVEEYFKEWKGDRMLHTSMMRWADSDLQTFAQFCIEKERERVKQALYGSEHLDDVYMSLDIKAP
jgi:hypothetical protein